MTTITKSRLNKVYRGNNRLLYALYHGQVWTTNTEIAEMGRIEPRVYKDTRDDRIFEHKRPIMDAIIDNPSTVEPVTAVVDIDGTSSIVTTASYQYNYNTTYVSYLVDKYGMANLLLEPLGHTSKLFAQDDKFDTVAVVMGLKS